ncbi:MAG: acetolactate synthase small subunit [Synergistaceae bacterium]|nr:acetolactate synthase small subunit [Synergistaceae bacterium]
MKNTFTILSEDNPGVLMRIAGLIYRRGYNIESLSVGQTDTPGISRFTVVIEGQEGDYDQIKKQLVKLIEVIEVKNLTKEGPFVERWLTLVKVRAPLDKRPHILQTAEVFRCRVVDIGAEAVTLEITGDKGKMNACMEAFRPYGILETAGSGQVALSRSGFVQEKLIKSGFAEKKQLS